jgi:hypothetical protein
LDNQRKIYYLSQFHPAKQNRPFQINALNALFTQGILLHTSAESSSVNLAPSRDRPAKNTPVRAKLSKLPARTIEGNNDVDG